MTALLNDSHLDAWRALLNAHSHVIDLIERDLAAGHRVPLRTYDVLTSLEKASGRCLRLSDLAEAIVLSRSGLSRLLDRLEKDGLIVRKACREDRRGAFAILTAKGRRALQRAWPVYERGIQAYFARRLSADEAKTLHRLLGRMRANPRRN